MDGIGPEFAKIIAGVLAKKVPVSDLIDAIKKAECSDKWVNNLHHIVCQCGPLYDGRYFGWKDVKKSFYDIRAGIEERTGISIFYKPYSCAFRLTDKI